MGVEVQGHHLDFLSEIKSLEYFDLSLMSDVQPTFVSRSQEPTDTKREKGSSTLI